MSATPLKHSGSFAQLCSLGARPISVFPGQVLNLPNYRGQLPASGGQLVFNAQVSAFVQAQFGICTIML